MNGDQKDMRRSITLVFLTVFAVSSMTIVHLQSAAARDYKDRYDVYSGGYKKMTIATPPFKSNDKERIELSDLLGQDLDMSGFFVVAPRSLMDKEFLAEGIDKKDIRFDQWQSLGVEVLCKTKVIEGDNKISLDAYVYDVSDGSLLLGKRYQSSSADWRRVIHRLADDIVQVVTGERGIMSSRVLFAAGNPRHKDIYVADLDGSALKKLTNHNQIVVSPTVSPDGRYVAFTSYKEGRPNIYVIDIDAGRDVFVEREEGMKIGATWADKKTLVYSHTSGRYSTIYSLNVETKEKKTLLRKDGILLSPTFSPDGSKMAFVSDMHGGANIFVRDVATGETKRLTYSGTYNTSPAFSPKGDLIAFVSRTSPNDFEICVMRPDGSNPQVLTQGGINDSPYFSPCGRYILYSSQKGGKTSLYVMLLNGDNKRPLKFTGTEEGQPKFLP
jgi:TolB protein